ncbi:hypothetical protein TNCT_699891 [Trichonephila clavata]|uniref:Uncharacterized protein n=1 Tax=Trichonephila clavata TaxID=2740835 RepID=A0A8X6HEK6_TRICU|nr:hypothetical protein TNCT_699891 [Trichonephila clavata]
MHGLQANGTFFRHAKTRDLGREHCTRVEEPCDPASPLFQILRAPIRPGHARLSVQIRFHAFCPNAPNIGAVTPFSHLVEHKVLGFERFDRQRERRESAIFQIPRRTENVAQGIEVVEMALKVLHRQHLWNG